MRVRVLVVIVVVVAMLAESLVLAASAQSQQTSWSVNDNPELFGSSRYWWAGDAGKGYGSNNYRYTYGSAGESSADNWARWSMGSRVGRQEIQVYVPNTRATATVLYRIDIGGSKYTRRVAQRSAYGWTALGIYDADGASVAITLRDNDASQHWNRHGYSASSIGVDAMRMRCVARCSPPPPTATPVPVRPPGAPKVLGAVVDVDNFGVAWSPPASDGGSPVTGYRVDLYRGSTRVGRKNVSASAREVTFAGLSADTAYEVRLSAQNSAGRGSAATADVRTAPAPATVPSAPRNVSASADEDSVDVSWSPPASDGGASVTGYRADLYRGSTRVGRKTVSGSARSASFTGLAADTAYQVRLSAQNSAGRGPAATANTRTAAAAVPVRPPGAPKIVGAVVDVDNFGVAWSPPASDGGSPVTGYRVDLYLGGSRVGRKTVSASAREVTFTGLSADTAYEVRVSAQNSAGRGSAATADVRTAPAPATVPSAPRNVSASADEDSVDVSWSAPSDDGGGSVTGYRVDLYLGSTRVGRKTVSGSARSASFAGLSADTAYEVRLSAQNSAGRGSAATASVRTQTEDRQEAEDREDSVPSVARNVSARADEDSVTVRWSRPDSNGGSAITEYQVELVGGSVARVPQRLASSARSATFRGLDPGTSFQVLVSARNINGLGAHAAAEARTRSARSVSISLGADRTGCDDQSMPCRWLSASYSEFPSGRYSAQCYQSASPGSLGTRFASFTANTSSGSDSTLCWFNGAAGRYLTAVIDGVHSNAIQFAGTVPARPPSEPLNVRVSADESSVTVSWSAPSDDGGASVTEYRVDLYRGSNRVDRKSLSGSARSTTFSGLSADTSYEVQVSAENSAGRSSPKSVSVWTLSASTDLPLDIYPFGNCSTSSKQVREPTPISPLAAKTQTDTLRDSDQLERINSWYQGEEGGTGKNGFWYTYSSDACAFWDLGSARGIYRLEYFYPRQDAVKYGSCDVNVFFVEIGCKGRPPTASPKFTIWECKREGCRIARVLNGSIRHSDGKRREGWWGWNNIKLDGHIIIQVSKRYDDDKYRLAADRVRIKWKNLLQEDKDEAIKLCQANALNEVIEQKKVIDFSNFGADLSRLFLLISGSYFTGLAAVKAPTVLSSLYSSVGSIKSAAAFARAAKEISLAIKTFQNATKYIDVAKYGLTFSQDVVDLTDQLASSGALGEHEHLYGLYKGFCDYADDTPVDWTTGLLDPYGMGSSLSGNAEPGDGCLPVIGQLSCVAGYHQYVTNHIGIKEE